jgi:hypothetical protein
MVRRVIQIEDRIYYRNPSVDRYQIPRNELVLLSQKVADVVVFWSEPSGYGALRQFSAHRGCDGPPDW